MKFEEPIAHQLIQVTKKYLSEFSKIAGHIPMERYHYVLLILSESEELYTQKELARILQVDKSFMVTMIDYLSDNDFVTREADQHDRRKHLIKLTDKAKKLVPEINLIFKNLNEKAFKNVSKENIGRFFDVLAQIQENLTTEHTHELVLDFKKLKHTT
jgi:DNA-binding MarR family transcriptional regulator